LTSDSELNKPSTLTRRPIDLVCGRCIVRFDSLDQLKRHRAAHIRADDYFRAYRISELVNFAKDLPPRMVWDSAVHEAKMRWLVSDKTAIEYTKDVIQILKASRAE
jgi:hypothetical protein